MNKLIFSFFAALSALFSTTLFAQEEHAIAVVAHRGFWNCEEAGFARNSIAALRCAQEAGFWGSEFDVNMTADEVVLVFHDATIGGKRINEYPAEEFKDFRLENGEPIPTLDQYLEQAEKHPETVLVFEIKKHMTPEMECRAVDICIDKLKAHNLFDPSKVIFISFSINICKYLTKFASDFNIQYLDSDCRTAELGKMGINAIDTYQGKFHSDPSWIREARSNNMLVNIWTVDREKDIRKAIGYKVDYITTNYPVLTRNILSELGVGERPGSIMGL